jgi:hypothetical protein
MSASVGTLCQKGFVLETSRSGGSLRHRGLPHARPLAWRQLQDQPRRVRRDALDDIAQIHERIDLKVLAGLHERAQDGRPVGRRFAASKEKQDSDG